MTRYAYDAAGRLRDLTYPTKLVVRYERDPATGEVTEVSNLTTKAQYAREVKHAPGGPLTSLTFGNGRTYAAVYDMRYEARSIESGPVVLGYDRNGG